MKDNRSVGSVTRLSHDRHVPNIAEADEQALAWVVRLTSGASTPEDHVTFRRWRDGSKVNAEALVRARALWAELDAVLPQVEQKHRRSPLARKRVGRWLAIAACLVLCIGLGHQYWQQWRFDHVTGTGEHRMVTLADGSQVVLGADTALNAKVEGNVRRIVLARGQAFFRVRHDSRSFIVETDRAKIRDLGTAFNVATGKASRITVTEGLIEISKGRSRARLAANQSIDVTRRGLGKVETVDARTATAWTRGRLVIFDRPLQEIVDKIAPYHSRRIVLLNEEVAQKRMSAVIELDDVELWLEALEGTHAVNTASLPGVLILG